MTDKQIIDVSNCIYHNNGKCTNPEIGQCNCANVASCYYKEYKRKEQECEELKKLCNGLDNTIDNYTNLIELRNQQLDQLKAENDELKKLLKVRIEDLCDSCGASSMMLMPCKVYEKTLTEIKEIAEICKCNNVDGCYECKYFDDCEVEDEEIPTRDICKLIIQKIKEVEDE